MAKYFVVIMVLSLGVILATNHKPTVQYVGPYSPEAYKAALMIKQGGTGAPYTLPIIEAGRAILAAQK